MLHEKFRLSKLIGDDETSVAWSINEAWDLRQLDEPELLQLAAEAGLVPCESACDFSVSREQHESSFIVFKHALH